eukprot:tig00021273_g19902.t1
MSSSSVVPYHGKRGVVLDLDAALRDVGYVNPAEPLSSEQHTAPILAFLGRWVHHLLSGKSSLLRIVSRIFDSHITHFENEIPKALDALVSLDLSAARIFDHKYRASHIKSFAQHVGSDSLKRLVIPLVEVFFDTPATSGVISVSREVAGHFRAYLAAEKERSGIVAEIQKGLRAVSDFCQQACHLSASATEDAVQEMHEATKSAKTTLEAAYEHSAKLARTNANLVDTMTLARAGYHPFELVYDVPLQDWK